MTSHIDKYNPVARVFHWGIALLILGLLGVGFFMDEIATPPFKNQLYGWHKSLGITVLCLAILRIIWRQIKHTPQPLSHHKQWEKILSKTIHTVLYVAMIAMPLSGWVMSSAGGHTVSFFGLFDLPGIVSEDRELGRLANQIHGYIAYTIIGCVGLHIVGALKHHIFDKDATLSRMGGHLVFAIIGLFLLAVALFIPAQSWVGELLKNNVVQDVPVQETGQTLQ